MGKGVLSYGKPRRVKSLWNPRYASGDDGFLPFLIQDRISSGVNKDVIHSCLNRSEEYYTTVIEREERSNEHCSGIVPEEVLKNIERQ